MNLTNPKVTIFFLAGRPQFVQLHPSKVALQSVTPDASPMLLTLSVVGSIALMAESVGTWLEKPSQAGVCSNGIVGTIFDRPAARLAAAEQQTLHG